MAFGRGNLHAVNFCSTYMGYLVSGYKSIMPNVTLSFAMFVLCLTEIWNGGLHDLNDFTSVSAGLIIGKYFQIIACIILKGFDMCVCIVLDLFFLYLPTVKCVFPLLS
jgi:hypothetical protein